VDRENKNKCKNKDAERLTRQVQARTRARFPGTGTFRKLPPDHGGLHPWLQTLSILHRFGVVF
jgi:hypothetical protein